MISEIEYVINSFEKHFHQFRNQKIVLHGSRNYAEAIIQHFGSNYNFVGIMSMDPLDGKSWKGLPVLNENDLVNDHIDMVILTERVKYAEQAFCMLRKVCREHNIEIYNMYGLDEFYVHYDANTASALSINEAVRRCIPYDIIAFEVMDTIFHYPNGQMIPNKLFSRLIPDLRRYGKELRFSLRKSFPEDLQILALKDYGFVQDEQKELIHRSGEDLSFRALKEASPDKKILYFGTGLVNEFILPRYYGIDSILYIDRNVLDFDCLRPNRYFANKKLFDPCSREKIQESIKNHRLISFDIFDTLLLRKTLYPRDVYELAEYKAGEAGYLTAGFAKARARAEDNRPYCNLDQIYEDLGIMYDWDKETEDAVKLIELNVERSVIEPRKEMLELFHYARSLGKFVVLTSDMYFPEPVLRDLLDEKGIRGYEKIFVSCAHHKSKQDGLYEELLRLSFEPGEILHIGDNPESDGISPEKFGIDSIIVPSALTLAGESYCYRPIKLSASLMERCLMGLMISRLFSDPFQNPNLWELPVEHRTAYIGNCVVGPLIVGHMNWLINNLKNGSYDGVLFFSRDGWLPYNLYKKICKTQTLPRGIYYYANRHSAFLCCADLESQSDAMGIKGIAFGLDMEQLLEKVYLLKKDEILPNDYKELNAEFIEKHMERIHKIAESSRTGYINYSKNLKMKRQKCYAVVDFISVGNTQRFLSKVLPYSFQGFYFGTYLSKHVENEPIDYYLQGNNPALLNGYVDLENYFSSPEPSVNYMSEEGTPVFQKEIRSEKDLRNIRPAWDAAASFADEFFDLFYIDGQVISPALIEELYDVIPYLGIEMSVYDDWFKTEVRKRP